MTEETMLNALRLNVGLERCTSKGGKRAYFCPECGSAHIEKLQHWSGTIFSCNSCDCWGAWTRRISRCSNA